MQVPRHSAPQVLRAAVTRHKTTGDCLPTGWLASCAQACEPAHLPTTQRHIAGVGKAQWSRCPAKCGCRLVRMLLTSVMAFDLLTAKISALLSNLRLFFYSVLILQSMYSRRSPTHGEATNLSLDAVILQTQVSTWLWR